MTHTLLRSLRERVAGARMPPPWFAELFGFREGPSYTANRKRFAMSSDGWLACDSAPEASGGRRMFVGPFETPSLAELLSRCQGEGEGEGEGEEDGNGGDEGAGDEWSRGLRFEHLADPVGVVALIADPRNAGAVFQAASQFNCLEMVGPGVSPSSGVTNYFNDPTQGPKCALACPAGTIFRNYFAGPDDRGQGAVQIDCLADVACVLSSPVAPAPWVMRNGYALPVDKSGIGDLGRRLVADPALSRAAQLALRVGVHWETSMRPPATHRIAQVYVSAMPVAYAKSVPSGEWAPLASVVLRGAYEATLAVAAVLSRRRGGARVRVFLTCVGGGAFGNRPAWIVDAIGAALEAFKDAPLDVALVHYGTVVQSAYSGLRVGAWG